MDNVRRFVTALTWSCAPHHVVHRITVSTPAVPFTDMNSLLPDNVQNTTFFWTFKNTLHHNILIRTVYKFRDISAISVAYFLWNNQQMQLYAVNFIPLLGSLYIFRVFFTPIIRSIRPHWEYVAETILWFVPVAVDTVKNCTPDDGCKKQPKHV